MRSYLLLNGGEWLFPGGDENIDTARFPQCLEGYEDYLGLCGLHLIRKMLFSEIIMLGTVHLRA